MTDRPAGLAAHLLATRTPEELARMVVAVARDNAALRHRVDYLEHENFWLQAKERDEPR